MREFTINGSEFERLAVEILGGDNLLRFKAKGSSMSPFLKDGDVIEVKPNHINSILVGDIILCRHEPDFLVAHRVVEVSNKDGQQQFVTQGDSLNQPDGPVTAEQVLGQVVAVERSGSRLKLDSRNGKVFSMLWVKFYPFVRRTRAVYKKIRI